MKELTIKVALVDDHPIFRDGIERLLKADKQIEVMLQAANGIDMLQQMESAAILPDIAVIDLNMPKMDGFMLSDEMKKKYPEIKFLILSAYSSDYNVAVVIKNGASGYLTKNCNPSDLRDAIHSIYETGFYYSDLANKNAFKILSSKNLKSINIPDREMQFFKLCCTEMPYEKIAKEMDISVTTLHGTRQRLFERLGIETRVALVVFAMQSGIINQPNQPNNLNIKF